MVEHHVLVHPRVGQLERASFQSPEQTSTIQKDRVECEPSLVFRWSFGTAWLLLHLRPHQSCDESNNVDRLQVGLESEHEAAGLGWPPWKNWVTAVARPPEPGLAWSPAPQAESDTIDPLEETTVEYPTSKRQARRSADPACLRHKTTRKLSYDRSNRASWWTRLAPPRSTPWLLDH